MRNWLLLAFFTCIAPWCVANEPESFGLVLRVRGDVTVSQGSAARPVKAFQYVKSGDRLRIAAAAEVLMTSYATTLLYQVSGPGVLEFHQDRVVVISGRAPATQPLHAQQVRLAAASRPVSARPGSLTMKSLTWPAVTPDERGSSQSTDSAGLRPGPQDDQTTWLLYIAALKSQGDDTAANAALDWVRTQWPTDKP